MLTIRYCPEAISSELVTWLREQVRYDADGRFSLYLVNGSEMPRMLADVAKKVCPGDYRSVILQAYRDGSATTPCHSDLGSEGFILSIGATRTFRLHRGHLAGPCEMDYIQDEIRIECVHGMVVLMDTRFNVEWHHQIVPDEGAGERLSLVFRK